MKTNLDSFGLAEIKDWVFDLDNTIYPASSSLFPRVAERMTSFIMEHFNLDAEAAAEMKTRLFRKYGTTMHGLMREHNMAPDDFLAYVHEIDLSDVHYDADLDNFISSLPGRKHIYTNGTTRHATRILEAFGIRHHFDFIFDIVASSHIPKPNPAPYQTFIAQSNIDPHTSVMVEDMARNLEPAAALGMKTVWLVSDHDWAANGADEDYVHYISADLKTFLAEIHQAHTL
jgi:putative hydrolase of the HAD superfamily